MILPKIRDKRFITIRRGGSLSDDDHRLLAVWAAQCAERVLHFFEDVRPTDDRPRRAVELTRSWVRGEITMPEARVAAFHSNAAAREVTGPAKLAAYSAGQAVAVAHVAAHYLGAAAYAIKAVRVANEKTNSPDIEGIEWKWQIEQLPLELRELVMEDQKNRNAICWNTFHAS